MPHAYVNRVATCVPPHDVHTWFVKYASSRLSQDPRKATLFKRLVDKGQIAHRYSFLPPSKDPGGTDIDADGIFRLGAFPSTAERMAIFRTEAPNLAASAIEKLELGDDRSKITHLVVTSCTGFSAPGVDLQMIDRCGLPSSIERTFIGFMGCYAAMNGLKMARHIVRSEPDAKVLLLNLELCTLHLQETTELEPILSFFLFADGCAASLISSDPVGIEMDSFYALLAPDTDRLITWDIGDSGFDMRLSGQVPLAIRDSLCGNAQAILGGDSVDDISLWAIHPGGRSVLDAVQQAMDLPAGALWASREVLLNYGNMSSATVMFVLKRLMETMKSGEKGCAMAFGPGLVAETMRFHAAETK